MGDFIHEVAENIPMYAAHLNFYLYILCIYLF